MKELSLRPYTGRLFVVNSQKEYESAHIKLFKTPDVLSCANEGRFSGGEGKDGNWTYLVYADKPSILAHEVSHVILHVFDRVGIDPREANGEPFCYMLAHLLSEARKMKFA